MSHPYEGLGCLQRMLAEKAKPNVQYLAGTAVLKVRMKGLFMSE